MSTNVIRYSVEELEELFTDIPTAAGKAREKGYSGNDLEAIARWMTKQDPAYVNQSEMIRED